MNILFSSLSIKQFVWLQLIFNCIHNIEFVQYIFEMSMSQRQGKPNFKSQFVYQQPENQASQHELNVVYSNQQPKNDKERPQRMAIGSKHQQQSFDYQLHIESDADVCGCSSCCISFTSQNKRQIYSFLENPIQELSGLQKNIQLQEKKLDKYYQAKQKNKRELNRLRQINALRIPVLKRDCNGFYKENVIRRILSKKAKTKIRIANNIRTVKQNLDKLEKRKWTILCSEVIKQKQKRYEELQLEIEEIDRIKTDARNKESRSLRFKKTQRMNQRQPIPGQYQQRQYRRNYRRQRSRGCGSEPRKCLASDSSPSRSRQKRSIKYFGSKKSKAEKYYTKQYEEQQHQRQEEIFMRESEVFSQESQLDLCLRQKQPRIIISDSNRNIFPNKSRNLQKSFSQNFQSRQQEFVENQIHHNEADANNSQNGAQIANNVFQSPLEEPLNFLDVILRIPMPPNGVNSCSRQIQQYIRISQRIFAPIREVYMMPNISNNENSVEKQNFYGEDLKQQSSSERIFEESKKKNAIQQHQGFESEKSYKNNEDKHILQPEMGQNVHGNENEREFQVSDQNKQQHQRQQNIVEEMDGERMRNQENYSQEEYAGRIRRTGINSQRRRRRNIFREQPQVTGIRIRLPNQMQENSVPNINRNGSIENILRNGDHQNVSTNGFNQNIQRNGIHPSYSRNYVPSPSFSSLSSSMSYFLNIDESSSEYSSQIANGHSFDYESN